MIFGLLKYNIMILVQYLEYHSYAGRESSCFVNILVCMLYVV